MRNILRIASLVLATLFTAVAQAEPIQYVFTGNWTGVPSGDFGASYTATIVFDNGGSSAASQTFGQADFVSARIQSGSFDVTMTGADVVSWSADFSSNGASELVAGWFDAANGPNSFHFDLDFSDAGANSGTGAACCFQVHVSSPGGQVIVLQSGGAAEPVPALPLGGLLVLTGLIGLFGGRSLRAQLRN